MEVADAQIVFVYGTLKSGYNNHPLLEGQEFLGCGFTKEKRFTLYSVNGHYSFPGMVERKEGGSRVFGEIYRINEPCMQTLDILEGVKYGLYSRVVIPVIDIEGKELQANAYLYNHKTDEDLHCGCCWPVQDVNKFLFADKRLRKDDNGMYALHDVGTSISSEPYKKLSELASWMETNSVAFGGDKLTMDKWKSVLSSLL